MDVISLMKATLLTVVAFRFVAVEITWHFIIPDQCGIMYME
jgi:hypothetical protein